VFFSDLNEQLWKKLIKHLKIPKAPQNGIFIPVKQKRRYVSQGKNNVNTPFRNMLTVPVQKTPYIVFNFV
jgi:hypothetical protein